MLKKEKYFLIKSKENNIIEEIEINEHKKRKLNPSLFMERICHQHCFYINKDINPMVDSVNENMDQILYNYLSCFFFKHISILTLTELLTLKQVKFSKNSKFYLKFYTNNKSNIFQYNIPSTIEEEQWIISFLHEFYKHFICLLDYHKYKTTLAIKNLFKGFFTFDIIFPISLCTGQNIEILDEYIYKLNAHFQNYDDFLLNLTLIENNSIACENNLFDNTLIIYLLNTNKYFSNHGINLFIHSYEHLIFLNYLKNNYYYLYQDFLKLIFIYLSKELYFKDYEHLVVEFQIKKNESGVKNQEDEEVIIIDSSNIHNLYSMKEDNINGKQKEDDFDEGEENEVIIVEENENSLNDNNKVKIVEENINAMNEMNENHDDDMIEMPENEKERKIDDEIIEIKEMEENSLSKIMNDIFHLLKEINKIPITLDYNNLYLYPTFIKDFRFINITKRNAISLFLELDEDYFNNIKG